MTTEDTMNGEARLSALLQDDNKMRELGVMSDLSDQFRGMLQTLAMRDGYILVREVAKDLVDVLEKRNVDQQGYTALAMATASGLLDVDAHLRKPMVAAMGVMALDFVDAQERHAARKRAAAEA